MQLTCWTWKYLVRRRYCCCTFRSIIYIQKTQIKSGSLSFATFRVKLKHVGRASAICDARSHHFTLGLPPTRINLKADNARRRGPRPGPILFGNNHQYKWSNAQQRLTQDSFLTPNRHQISHHLILFDYSHTYTVTLPHLVLKKVKKTEYVYMYLF
jgi:hypothetical protein